MSDIASSRDTVNAAMASVFGDIGPIETQRLNGYRTWRVTCHQLDAAYVVKFYTSGSSAGKREAHALRYLRSCTTGFPLPFVKGEGIDPESGHSFLVMTEISGRTLHQAEIDGYCDQKRALMIVGQLLRQQHRATMIIGNQYTDVFNRFISACEHQVRVLHKYGANAVAELARLNTERMRELSSMRPNRVFGHGDLHPSNVLVDISPKGCVTVSGVCDFESAGTSIPECDLAKSVVVSLAAEGGAGELAILRGYGQLDLSQHAIRVFSTFHAIDGWLYGGLVQGRDRALWDLRLRRFAAHNQQL